MPKGDRLDWLVQKVTELGVDRIVLLHAERSVVRWKPERAAAQLDRLQRIADEACRQSRRVWRVAIDEPVDAVDGARAASSSPSPVGAISLPVTGRWPSDRRVAGRSMSSISAAELVSSRREHPADGDRRGGSIDTLRDIRTLTVYDADRYLRVACRAVGRRAPPTHETNTTRRDTHMTIIDEEAPSVYSRAGRRTLARHPQAEADVPAGGRGAVEPGVQGVGARCLRAWRAGAVGAAPRPALAVLRRAGRATAPAGGDRLARRPQRCSRRPTRSWRSTSPSSCSSRARRSRCWRGTCDSSRCSVRTSTAG